MNARKAELCRPATTETQLLVSQILSHLCGLPADHGPVDIETSIFELGITSTDLFVLSKRISQSCELQDSIAVSTILTNPTVSGIATAVDRLHEDGSEYSPLVTLHDGGDKAPLFLVHPGSGDVLVFVALAKYFPERPVYGIRTRGLGESR